MATLVVYPNPTTSVDGFVRRQAVNETFAALIAGDGTSAGDTDTDTNVGRLQADTSTNRFKINQRGIVLFDTSPLTVDATISAGTFSYFGQDLVGNLGIVVELDIVESTPASNTALANADYGQLGGTVFSSMAYGDFDLEAYNDFALDANGVANISKTGISKFGSKLNWDTDGSFGGSWVSNAQTYFSAYMSDSVGTTKDPKLTVTYTLPGAAGGTSTNFMLLNVG
jgi:hypothetical protein